MCTRAVSHQPAVVYELMAGEQYRVEKRNNCRDVAVDDDPATIEYTRPRIEDLEFSFRPLKF